MNSNTQKPAAQELRVPWRDSSKSILPKMNPTVEVLLLDEEDIPG